MLRCCRVGMAAIGPERAPIRRVGGQDEIRKERRVDASAHRHESGEQKEDRVHG